MKPLTAMTMGELIEEEHAIRRKIERDERVTWFSIQSVNPAVIEHRGRVFEEMARRAAAMNFVVPQALATRR